NYTNLNGGTLSKYNTSKPLPLLPGERANPKPSVPTATVSNIEELTKNYQFKDLYQENEDDEGDYEYDYVCLESKKKLEDDDQKIKGLLSQEVQFKYEQMVLNFENVNFNNLAPTASAT